MSDRQQRLLTFIEQATGKASYRGPVQEKGTEGENDKDNVEAERTIAVEI